MTNTNDLIPQTNWSRTLHGADVEPVTSCSGSPLVLELLAPPGACLEAVTAMVTVPAAATTIIPNMAFKSRLNFYFFCS